MKLSKILGSAIALGASLILVSQVSAAGTIKSAKLTLSNSTGGTSGVTYTFTFTHPGSTIQAIKLDFCSRASTKTDNSAGCDLPTSMGLGGAAKGAFTNLGANGDWSLSVTGTTDLQFTATNPEVVGAGAAASLVVSGVQNPATTNNCSASGSTTTCYVRYADFTAQATTGTSANEGTFTFTILTEVTVSARVDPTFTFVVGPVNAGQVRNDITTSVTSTYSTLPFGNLTAGTPKYAAHALTVTTNTQGGYTVQAQVTTQLTGVYTDNNIDPFIHPWGTPAGWTEPSGQTPNDNTGWFGGNTTDTDVSGWDTGSEKFGGLILNTPVTVMSKNTSDNGATSVYVTYALEANVFQPADAYTGKMIYNALPTY